MKRLLVLSILTIAFFYSSAFAQTENEESKPDFSTEALLVILNQPEETVKKPVIDFTIETRWGLLRFLPIMMSLTPNGGEYGPTVHGPLDPFHLTGTQFAATAATAPNRSRFKEWTRSEKRYRRKMLSSVRRLNQVDRD